MRSCMCNCCFLYCTRVIVGQHSHNLRYKLIPAEEDFSGAPAARMLGMTKDHGCNKLNLRLSVECGQRHHGSVTKRSSVVQQIRDATRHTSRKVSADPAQHHDSSTSHVLTTVIANSFNHHIHAAVPHTNPLACDTVDVSLATRRAVERNVADDHILFRNKRGIPGRNDDDLSA